jgi:hypothetical protein
MAKENVNSIIIEALGIKPIAFNPELANIVKSATAGLFMSQLLYWWEKGSRKECIYKSVEAFQKETCLTRSEQTTAIKKWKALGVLMVRNEGIPQTRHFYLDTEELINLLKERAKKKGIRGHYLTR